MAGQTMSHDAEANDTPFPWHLGVFDAHCHPTDTMSSIAGIPQMKARTLTVMATRGEDQDLVGEVAASMDNSSGKQEGEGNGPRGEKNRIVPCFGWHPWFSYQIYDTTTLLPPAKDTTNVDLKKAHYENVLAPSPKNRRSPQTDHFIAALPAPLPLSTLINNMRTRLQSNPCALVGEVGLDRAFRLPNPWTREEIASRDETVTPGSREGRTLSPYRVHLEHQKTVLRAQLRLAGELGRAVSVHSVQAHGAVFDLLKELWKGFERRVPPRRERRRRYSATGAHEESDAEEQSSPQPHSRPSSQNQSQNQHENGKAAMPFPPRICMHSYSGPVDPIKQFLHPTNPSTIYFSFSNVINFSSSSSAQAKVIEVIKALPDDRILVESDLHTAGPVMDGLLESVVRQICGIRGWELTEGVRRLGDNWRGFVYG